MNNIFRRINSRRLEKRLVLTTAIAVLVIPSLICAVFVLVLSQTECLSGKEDIYFQLPPSVQNVESREKNLSRSCTVRIKFHVASNELETFLDTTFIGMTLSSTELPQSIGGIDVLQAETGWDLSLVSSYLAGEARGTGDHFLDEQMIFVDTSDPEDYVVYFTTKVNWL